MVNTVNQTIRSRVLSQSAQNGASAYMHPSQSLTHIYIFSCGFNQVHVVGPWQNLYSTIGASAHESANVKDDKLLIRQKS